MRKIVPALFLALAALTAGFGHAAAMDGFDLGDMPPLPPPLLDDSPNPPPLAPPIAPPRSGSLSPLAGGGAASGVTPAVPPIAADAGTGTDAEGMDFASPLPIAPPPAIAPGTASAGSVAPPSAPQAIALPGQLGAAAPASSPSPAVPETPRPGRIEGGRVNVRAGPNTQYESIAVLTSGAPVTVLARHGEWFKIVFPADQLASIHKNYVAADITGEIPEAGLPGVVSQDNATVHAFYWDKSTVVGTLPKGAPVVIKQERGQWYRIVPPENARAYVFASYVRVDGAQDIAADSAPAPVNPAVDLTAGVDADGRPRQVKLSKDQERVLEIKEAYYNRLRERLAAEEEAEEAAEKAALEARKLQATQLDSALKDLDSRLTAIDQETSQRIEYIAREFLPQQTMVTGIGAAAWAPPDPAGGGYTGWIENMGRVGGAPTPYRLTKGGEIRFYLVSDQFNLDEFTSRRVWLNGPVEYAGGASASVLKVDQIRILTELEIAQDMRRQQEQWYGSSGSEQQAVDPYAAAPYASPETPSSGDFVSGTEYGTVTEYGPGGAPVAEGYGMPVQQGGFVQQGAPVQQGVIVASPQGYAGYDSGAAYIDPNAGASASGSGEFAVPAYIDPATGAVYTSPSSSPGSEPYLVPGQVYSGAIPSAPVSSGQPYPAVSAPEGGISPSDPSQLPDVVDGSGGRYYGYGTDQSIGIGGGMTVGEVETDRYERPVINEIAP